MTSSDRAYFDWTRGSTPGAPSTVAKLQEPVRETGPGPYCRKSAGAMISFTLSHLLRASVPRVGAGLAAAARALLLLQGLFPSVLSRLMMTDDAAGAGAENAVMAGIVPGDSADGGALQAASRLRRSRNPTGSH